MAHSSPAQKHRNSAKTNPSSSAGQSGHATPSGFAAGPTTSTRRITPEMGASDTYPNDNLP